ncbi:MAG: hypothetical protein WCC03_17085 [Candidatus Acidiferrales bacterium]
MAAVGAQAAVRAFAIRLFTPILKVADFVWLEKSALAANPKARFTAD